MDDDMYGLCVTFGFIFGAIIGAGLQYVNMSDNEHSERHGCEYVEKSECKQVWVKK